MKLLLFFFLKKAENVVVIPEGNEKHNQEVEAKGNRLLELLSSPHSLFRTLTLLCYAAFSSLLILLPFLFFIYLPPALALPLLCSAQCKFASCPSWPPCTEKVLVVTPVNACEVAVCLPLQAASAPPPTIHTRSATEWTPACLPSCLNHRCLGDRVWHALDDLATKNKKRLG